MGCSEQVRESHTLEVVSCSKLPSFLELSHLPVVCYAFLVLRSEIFFTD